MRPAFSVLLLTTLIGAGQGLFLALVTVQTYALAGLVAPAQPALYPIGAAVALALLAAGLVASFFHLGRPERAWRAASQWRTSWLSREVIVLPAFMAVVFAYGAAHAFDIRPVLVTLGQGVAIDVTLALAAVGTALAFALYVCTGMIYACLPFLREWHSWLTPVNYTLLGAASGFTLAAALAAVVSPAQVPLAAGWSVVLTLLALATRGAALMRNARLAPKSPLAPAIGVKHPRIVQISQGAMGGSFNTREFFHGRSERFVRGVRAFFLIAGFAVPVLLVALAFAQPQAAAAWLALAFAVQYAGLLAERWYFFAEARHPQNLYYQAVA
ncbi:MAG: dimethyl sulfoxide reductase anchor subunit [Burkholderiaceae bacterium]|nr:dimethyl sulfoxide reductase anchor subunit [Burkholderiaceae bacterium]